MTPTEAYTALNLIPKLGPVRLRRLLAAFESPERVLLARTSELAAVEGIGREIAESIKSWESQVDLLAELRMVKEFGATLLTLASPDYPALLRQIHDPPTVLYVWGRLAPQDSNAVAVVGTRKPTHYGTECAKRLSYQLAHAGLTIVSGLARGVDTFAHQAALAAKGRTIAVLGSGLGKLYPAENAPLAAKIAESGAVVTEFGMTVPADRQTFPIRNRIVSGCSFGLLVIEAGLKSGAMITAAQAGDQGRSLYAVPGRIDNPYAAGPNRLIQQGAKLVSGAQDLLDDFGMLFREAPRLESPRPTVAMSETEATVYEALGGDELSSDEIKVRTGLPIAEISSSLLQMELRQLVKSLPGGRFVRIL